MKRYLEACPIDGKCEYRLATVADTATVQVTCVRHGNGTAVKLTDEEGLHHFRPLFVEVEQANESARQAAVAARDRATAPAPAAPVTGADAATDVGHGDYGEDGDEDAGEDGDEDAAEE